MTKERARKRKVRDRMAATGERFSVAARALEGNSYMRTAWGGSDWMRLLPSQAMALEIVICTASVEQQPGTLKQLIEHHPARNLHLPQGVHTPLTWDGEADEETRPLVAQAVAAFHVAVMNMGKSVPTTVGELASLLADFGVYQHTRGADGVHWWKADNELPAAASVLPLPATWLAREEEVTWKTTTGAAAFRLSNHLHKKGRPLRLDTSIDRLATDLDDSTDLVCDALDGMVYRGWLAVQRHGTTIGRDQLQHLQDHSKITLLINWHRLDHSSRNDPGIAITEFQSEFEWADSPWAVYGKAEQMPEVDRMGLELLSRLPFRQKTTHHPDKVVTLDELASVHRMSVSGTVMILHELEYSGLLSWDPIQQCSELAEPDSDPPPHLRGIAQ